MRRCNEALRQGFLFHALRVDARAIVGNFQLKVAAFVEGADAHGSLFGLAHLAPFVGRLDAVIDRVAENVRHRIFDGLEQTLIEFGVAALGFQLHLFSQVLGNIAYDARQLVEHLAYRLHARLHHVFAQFGSDRIQTVDGQIQVALIGVRGDLQQAVAQQDQFAHQVHLLLEQIHVHADDGIAGLGLFLVGQGVGDVALGDHTQLHQDLAQFTEVALILQLQRVNNFFLTHQSAPQKRAADSPDDDSRFCLTAFLFGLGLGGSGGYGLGRCCDRLWEFRDR